jgi:hypothetical protein
MPASSPERRSNVPSEDLLPARRASPEILRETPGALVQKLRAQRALVLEAPV